MAVISPILIAALIESSKPGPTPLEVVEASHTCYDAALIGRIVDTDDFQDLNEALPRKDGSLWWGGVASFHVRREIQLVGQSAKLGWVRGLMSAQPLPTAKILLFTKTHKSGIPIVVYWTSLRNAAAQKLSEAPVKRCPSVDTKAVLGG